MRPESRQDGLRGAPLQSSCLYLLRFVLYATEEAAPVEETLSDVDMDMDQYIVQDDVELRRKQEMWCTVNKDWLEAQELKQAQLEEAHRVRLKSISPASAVVLVIAHACWCASSPCLKYISGLLTCLQQHRSPQSMLYLSSNRLQL